MCMNCACLDGETRWSCAPRSLPSQHCFATFLMETWQCLYVLCITSEACICVEMSVWWSFAYCLLI
jgi:hypothetical protein